MFIKLVNLILLFIIVFILLSFSPLVFNIDLCKNYLKETMMYNTKLNSQKLFSIALILGMGGEHLFSMLLNQK